MIIFINNNFTPHQLIAQGDGFTKVHFTVLFTVINWPVLESTAYWCPQSRGRNWLDVVCGLLGNCNGNVINYCMSV